MRSLSIDTVEDQTSALFTVGPGSLHSTMTSLVGGLRMAQEFKHQPVLRDEVTELFTSVPAGVIVDATLGGAGHSEALLESRGDIGIVGLDRDKTALRAAEQRLGVFGSRVVMQHARFSAISGIVEQGSRGVTPWPQVSITDEPLGVVGILADLGVSSPQIDSAERGFSFSQEGPFDMRMDETQGMTASAFLDQVTLDELTVMLRENGEGRFARRIAKALLEARPVSTTQEVVDVVDRAVPKANRRRGHVASRVFQAFRISVNSEMSELLTLLEAAAGLLVPQGRLAVISYHSGEDAMVKHLFRSWEAGGCTCPSHLPCVCGAVSLGTVLTKRAVVASDDEIAANPRARSARLRSFEVAS